jgi:7-cyano-7-deazaguanine synthase
MNLEGRGSKYSFQSPVQRRIARLYDNIIPAQEGPKKKDFVVISGGPDSATLINEVNKSNKENASIATEGIFINFGQPYLLQELTSARRVAEQTGVKLNEIVVPGLSHAFIGDGEFGYIIFRNVIEASYGIAASFARYHEGRSLYHANIKEDVDDLPWMPDFFSKFTDAVKAINDVSGEELEVHSPYLKVPKAEVFQRADSMDVDLSSTWSCLKSGEHHCGECRSCLRRKGAFQSAVIFDATEYNK